MATRWIRWNTTTHIFEYSTDGVVFNTLPLNASILNEGTLDAARLPASVPLLASNNIFAGVNRISAANPALQLNETDQGADLKNWDLNLDAQILKIRKLNDAYAAPAELLTINRDGRLVINAQAAVSHDLSCNANGSLETILRNANAGASALSVYKLGNDAASNAGRFLATSSISGFAEPYLANRVVLDSAIAGGLSLAANHASGGISFYTGGSSVARMLLTSAGNAELSGTIKERARTTPIGEWINVAFNAGDFTASAGTWTVEAGDVSVFRYMLIGKTLFFDIRVLTTTTSAGMGSQLLIKVPGGFTVSSFPVGVGHWNLNGTYETGLWTASGTNIALFRNNFTTNWTSSLTNSLDVRLQGFIAIV